MFNRNWFSGSKKTKRSRSRHSRLRRLQCRAFEALEERLALSGVDFVPFTLDAGEPDKIAVADFDVNGFDDYVTPNTSLGTVGVRFFGLGTLEFNYPVGASPLNVAAGDVNGDSHPDVVTVNIGNTVSVLLGDGLGGFAAPIVTPVNGISLIDLVVVDFNGDGWQDVATVNGTSHDVSVLLSNGVGGFVEAAGSPHALGNVSLRIEAGDFNSDQHMDLVTVNRTNTSTDELSVFLGNGSGGFAPAPGSPVPVSAIASGVAVADLDNDGALDLAVSTHADDSVRLLMGDNTGQFHVGPQSLVGVGTNPESIAVGEFNGDNYLDLATTSAFDNEVSVLLGVGSGIFAPAVAFPVGSSPGPIAVGDFNWDGLSDLVVGNEGDSTATVLINALPRIRIDDVSIVEGDAGTTSAIVHVRRYIDGNVPVSLDYFVESGTATAGIDFESTAGSLTFLPGQSERWIVVPIIGDTEMEGDETLNVRLANLSFGTFVDDTATVTIINDDSLLTAEANGPYDVLEGDSVALSSAGSGDSDGTIVEFAWDFDYDGVSFSADTLEASPDFSAVGLDGPATRTVALRVTDDDGNTSLDTATINIGNAAPVVDAGPDDTIGQATVFSSMGSFTDPGPDVWTATVDYGDGTGPQPLVLNPDKTFSLSHSYSAHGSFTVTVTVDDGDDVGSDTATVNVLNEPPQVDAGGPYTVDEGGTVIISGASASDIDGSIVSYEWDLDYDGVTFDANAFGPAPLYSAAGVDGPGTRTVALLVTDNDGASAFDTATVNIINVSPVVSAGPDAAIATGATFSASGSFVDPGPDDWTATVDYGDGEGMQPLALNPDKTFDLSHAFTSPGTYLVTVNVDDGDGGMASDSLNVTVVAPPTVESIVIGDGSAQRSMVTSVTVTFSTIVDLDPGVFELDQLGYGSIAYQVDTSILDGKTVSVLSFAGPTTIAGSLADGDYLLTVRADRAHDALGQQLDGDGDGTSGGDALKEFFRLFGDTEGDGDVDKEDRDLFNQALGSVSGDPDYLSFLDFDGDGHIDQLDRKEFNKRFSNK